MEAKYNNQVRLLLDVLPFIADESCFVVHGGTAINLFLRDMPRLSVDIDLTYLHIEERSNTLAAIARALITIQERISPRMQNVSVTLTADKSRLIVRRRDATIKIEVNTVMRGCLMEPVRMQLNEVTQAMFERFAEAPIMHVGQLYGGKICAALDRQHPRDLFDVMCMFEVEGFTEQIKRGFLLCLLSSDRPIHELLSPSLLDQRNTLENHFAGMTERPFSYIDFEATRRTLIETLSVGLSDSDARFLVTFTDGDPAWAECGFDDFKKFPGVQWKLNNVRKLKSQDPMKHRRQLDLLSALVG